MHVGTCTIPFWEGFFLMYHYSMLNQPALDVLSSVIKHTVDVTYHLITTLGPDTHHTTELALTSSRAAHVERRQRLIATGVKRRKKAK